MISIREFDRQLLLRIRAIKARDRAYLRSLSGPPKGPSLWYGPERGWEPVKDRLLELAGILERDGFVTNKNAPDWCRGND